jgi:hypothetical protein
MFKIVRDSMLVDRVNHDLSPTKSLLPAAVVDDVVKYFKQRSNIELEYMIFFSKFDELFISSRNKCSKISLLVDVWNAALKHRTCDLRYILYISMTS